MTIYDKSYICPFTMHADEPKYCWEAACLAFNGYAYIRTADGNTTKFPSCKLIPEADD